MSDPEPGWCYHCGRSYRKAQTEELPCETPDPSPTRQTTKTIIQSGEINK